MRISQSTITRTLLQNLNRSRENMGELQTTMATGKEVRRSSQDPARFARAARFRRAISMNEHYLKNVRDARGWIETGAASLDNLHTLLLKAKEVAIQGADAAYTADNHEAMAKQVDGWIEEALSEANTSYLEKHVFAGSATDGNEAPFALDDDRIVHRGNVDPLLRRIAGDEKIAINVTGVQLVETGLFSSLIGLRDALRASDEDAIRSSIEELDSAARNVTAISAGVGALQNRLSLVEERLNTANINLTSYLSQAEDADLAEIITHYNAEELAYRAALQTTNDALQLNLLQYLR